jgi:hypothetical protein
MQRFLLTVFLSAMVLPVYAQSTQSPSVPRFSASVGSFLPKGSTNDRHSQTLFTYQPRLKSSALPLNTAVYLETNRHKTLVGTTTRVSVMEGIGLMQRVNFLPTAPKTLYQFGGVGLYQRRISTTTVTGTGSTAVTTATHTRGISPGVKLGVGYQKDAMFVELDYTLIGRIKGSSPSGLGLRVGTRL